MSVKWLVFGLLFWSPLLSASELYVSTSGNDSNSGSASAPFRTIQKAVAVATAGTTVHVAPGTYSGPIHSFNKGTASSPVRFVSDIKWGAKIIPGGSDSAWWDEGTYVEINGFDVDGQGGSAWRTGLIARGTNTLLINNHVHHIAQTLACDSNGGAGISTSDYSYGTNQDVIGNVVHHIGYRGCNFIHGIYATAPGNVKNNLVYQIGRWGITLWHDASNINIVNNTVFGSSGGIEVGGGDYYHIPGPVDNVNVQNNIVYDNDDGILEQGDVGTHNSFLNNLSFGNRNFNYKLLNSHSGDVNADPQFVNYVSTGGGDYHLKNTSPAIDRGVASYAPSLDLDGKARPQGFGYDLGVYEAVAVVSPTPAPQPAPSPTPVPVPATAAISVSATQLSPGASVKIQVTGGGSSTGEYVALYRAGDLDSAWAYQENWLYLNGTKTEPTSPISSATLTMTVPMEPGLYNIRFFKSENFAVAGNLLAVSSNITVSAVDTTAPVTSILSPANGAKVQARHDTVIQASATDQSGVSAVRFYVNGSLTCTVTAIPYTCRWRVPRGSGRVYQLQTTATDAAGNTGRSSLMTVTSY